MTFLRFVAFIFAKGMMLWGAIAAALYLVLPSRIFPGPFSITDIIQGAVAASLAAAVAVATVVEVQSRRGRPAGRT